MTVRRGLLLLVIAGLVLTACGGDSEPESFSEYTDPIESEYSAALLAGLPEGEDAPPADAVPVLQRNFLEGCITGGTENPPTELQDSSGDVRTEALVAVCGCSYYAIRDYFLGLHDNLEGGEQQKEAVDDFRNVNNDLLESSDASLPPELTTLVANCVRSEAGA